MQSTVKYPDCWRNTLKSTNFTEIFWKLLIFTRHGKWADPKNTRISFLHKTFQETLKIPESEHYTLKIRRALPITLPWKCPPGAKINYLYAEALLFVWQKGCFPQTEVKSRKTKENGIFHLWENGPHSSDEGRSLHQNQPSHRVSQKNC